MKHVFLCEVLVFLALVVLITELMGQSEAARLPQMVLGGAERAFLLNLPYSGYTIFSGLLVFFLILCSRPGLKSTHNGRAAIGDF